MKAHEVALGDGARRALLLLVFTDLAGFGMLIPDVQLRAERLGARGWLIGAILSSMFVVQVLISPLWGSLSDRIGRKPVILTCTALSALSMLLYTQAISVWIILATRILAGLGAANVSTVNAAFADASLPERRAALMGQAAAASSAGLILGPALGGVLSARGGAVALGAVAGASSLLGIVIVAFLMPNLPPRARSPEDRLSTGVRNLLRQNRILFVLFAAATTGWFALACLEGTFGRLIERTLGLGSLAFGLIFAYESVVTGVVQYLLVQPLQQRLGERRLVAASFVLQGTGLAGMPFARSIPVLLISATVYAIGNGLLGPSVNGWCSRVTPEHQQGAMFGLLQSARSIGFMVGPSLGGLLFDIGPSALYMVAGGVSVAAASLVLAATKGQRREAVSTAE